MSSCGRHGITFFQFASHLAPKLHLDEFQRVKGASEALPSHARDRTGFALQVAAVQVAVAATFVPPCAFLTAGAVSTFTG